MKTAKARGSYCSLLFMVCELETKDLEWVSSIKFRDIFLNFSNTISSVPRLEAGNNESYLEFEWFKWPTSFMTGVQTFLQRKPHSFPGLVQKRRPDHEPTKIETGVMSSCLVMTFLFLRMDLLKPHSIVAKIQRNSP